MTCQLIESSNAAAKAVAPGARLSQAAEAALRDAHGAETHVGASYAAIVARYGPVAPFDKLLKAERRHAAALATMMKAYGLAVPKNAWGSEAKPLEPLPDTVAAACAACAEARAADVRQYDDVLIPAVTGVPGLAELFGTLRDRARDRQLPAFQRGIDGGLAVPHLHGHPHHHSDGYSHDQAHDQAHEHEHAHGGRDHHRCGQTHAKGH